MIYGYLRVSTDEQDVNSQKQGVVAFAKDKQWTIDEYITDEGISGGTDPDKRNLGKLLDKLHEGDIIIASEISRLGRDLYMVMDILHYAMKVGCTIYTVKDHFVLGDDIQSKVLAFAFGLSAEIERQMIKQRTKEGLRQRVKLGILLGRPPQRPTNMNIRCDDEKKQKILEQYNWGVPQLRLAQNFGVNKDTIARWLHDWGVKKVPHIEKQKQYQLKLREMRYKEGDYCVVNLSDDEYNDLKTKIEANLTIPQIANIMTKYTYEQLYDTILCDVKLHTLYRSHAQKDLIKHKIKVK